MNTKFYIYYIQFNVTIGVVVCICGISFNTINLKNKSRPSIFEHAPRFRKFSRATPTINNLFLLLLQWLARLHPFRKTTPIVGWLEMLPLAQGWLSQLSPNKVQATPVEKGMLMWLTPIEGWFIGLCGHPQKMGGLCSHPYGWRNHSLLPPHITHRARVSPRAHSPTPMWIGIKKITSPILVLHVH